MYRFTFTQREFDTILAALRAYQADQKPLISFDPHVVAAIAAGQHGEPLDADEIDVLCEYINPSNVANYKHLDGLVEGIPPARRL
jgi:hypothetical protein